MAAEPKLTLKVTTAWWLPLYLKGVVYVAAAMGCEPDWVKVQRTVQRALRVKLVQAP